MNKVRVRAALIVMGLFYGIGVPLALGVDNFFKQDEICGGLSTVASCRLIVAHPYEHSDEGLILPDYYVYVKNNSDPVMVDNPIDLSDGWFMVKTNVSGVIDVCILG